MSNWVYDRDRHAGNEVLFIISSPPTLYPEKWPPYTSESSSLLLETIFGFPLAISDFFLSTAASSLFVHLSLPVFTPLSSHPHLPYQRHQKNLNQSVLTVAGLSSSSPRLCPLQGCPLGCPEVSCPQTGSVGSTMTAEKSLIHHPGPSLSLSCSNPVPPPRRAISHKFSRAILSSQTFSLSLFSILPTSHAVFKAWLHTLWWAIPLQFLLSMRSSVGLGFHKPSSKYLFCL